ncbi:hypothetical protein DL95DRAFT_401158 [Leptodontidium sp. 2 PMI_412]|nr:hypothetical protein DL95DRAFT_401158 [Leptodontidium sp. 2 PMI_412]
MKYKRQTAPDTLKERLRRRSAQGGSEKTSKTRRREKLKPEDQDQISLGKFIHIHIQQTGRLESGWPTLPFGTVRRRSAHFASPPVAESSSRTGPGAAPALHLARVPGVNPSSGGGSRATGELELRWAALIRCWHWSGRPQHPADTFCPPTLRATLTHSLARRRAAWLTDWLASGLLVWSLLVWRGVAVRGSSGVLQGQGREANSVPTLNEIP